MHGFSSTFAKAFQTPDQGPFAGARSYIYNFTLKPNLPDGFVLCAEGGATTSESMAFMPFCDANPGTLLRTRMIYWNAIGTDPNTRIWLGIPIVEVLGTVSNACGPTAFAERQLLTPTDRFCDNIVLTGGNLGLTGTIYSFGAGTDLPALVNAEIQGARLISFDTQAEDANGNYIPGVNGNVLWAKFS